MFEHRKQPLISTREFIKRVGKYTALALLLVAVSWLIGILGYRLLEGLPWIDATLNAAMILGGMGPVNQLTSTSAKVFASIYALFSGLVFIAVMGIVFSPIAHRMLHKFHVDDKDLQ